MQKKHTKNSLLEKENDRKNVNKWNTNQPFSKVDRFLLIKKSSNVAEKPFKELKVLSNRNDASSVSNYFTQKTNKLEMQPLFFPLTNTQQFCKFYAHDIIENSRLEFSTLGLFLKAHDIDKSLRARMLDWMIEVTSSYKFTPKTYFASVHLMDSYFKAQEESLPITRLHIAGAVAMLIASKMDEVYPLKIKTVYQKIVHKKIERKELIQMERKMTQKLGFILNVWSFYDLAVLKLHKSYENNEETLQKIENLCQYIAKFMVFNYQLYGHYTTDVLAQALLKAVCKIGGYELSKSALSSEQNPSQIKQQQLCLQLILETVKGFKTSFHNLNNIFKYAQPGNLEKVQQFFKHY